MGSGLFHENLECHLFKIKLIKETAQQTNKTHKDQMSIMSTSVSNHMQGGNELRMF